MTTKLYDDKYLETLQNLFAKTKQRSYELVNPQLNETIADIGCAIGQDVVNLAKSGAKVVGIDNDPNFIAIANKQPITDLQVEFICCNADNVPLASHSIETVRFDRVLQHIADHDKVLKEVKRLLKPTGKLIIVDTDYLSLSFVLDDEKLERKIVDAVAYKRIPNGYKVRQLPKTLEKHNFKILSAEIHNYVINDYASATSLIHFDKAFDEELRLGNISETEQAVWQKHLKGHFNLSINLMVFSAQLK